MEKNTPIRPSGQSQVSSGGVWRGPGEPNLVDPPAHTTLSEAVAAYAVSWYQKQMYLQDWAVWVCINPTPPGWAGEDTGHCGGSDLQPGYKKARIWVSEERSVGTGFDPLATLFHELNHVLFRDALMERDGDGGDRELCESPVDRLAVVLARAYRAGVR